MALNPSCIQTHFENNENNAIGYWLDLNKGSMISLNFPFCPFFTCNWKAVAPWTLNKIQHWHVNPYNLFTIIRLPILKCFPKSFITWPGLPGTMWFVVVADGNRGKGGAGTVTVGGWVLPTMADKTMLWILELSGLFLRYLNGSHVTDSRIIQSPINSHLQLLLFRVHPNLD